MSDILIRGMEMTTRCAECWLMDGEDSWCTAFRVRHLYPEYRYGIKDRPDWCPLIEIKPHGDLIDRDALMKQIEHDTPLSAVFEKTMRRYLRNASTIIPAEPPKEET